MVLHTRKGTAINPTVARGLSARTEDDYARIFAEHEAIIRDELLVPAVAAYGEMVRTRIQGIWRKSSLFQRGEPVIARPGRPWTSRRVVLEVLDLLDLAPSRNAV